MIVKYRVSDGEIICAGSLKDLDVQKGEAVIEIEYRFISDIRAYKVFDGQLIVKTTQEKDAYLYVDKRRAEYPSIEDQLDAIWKGNDDMEAMRKTILDIKEKYPKPDGVNK